MKDMDCKQNKKRRRNMNTTKAKKMPINESTSRGDMEESDFLEKGFAGKVKKPFSKHEL